MKDNSNDMGKRIDISVVIVNWNTRELLLSCIDSIVRKTHKVSLEIIVVDNASSDGSQKAVLELFPNVILIQNNENLGFAKANNIGIKVCSGRYIALVNSDVVIKEGCLDKMKGYLDDRSEVGVLGPRIYYPDGKIQASCKRFPSLWSYFCAAIFLNKIFPKVSFFAHGDIVNFSYDQIRRVDYLIGAFWLIRKEALQQVGLLDERFYFYSEDVDYCNRFWSQGWKVVFFPESEIVHFTGSSSNKTPVKFYIQQRYANLQYWNKYYNKFSLIILIIIMFIHQINRLISYAILYLLKPIKRGDSKFKIVRSIACANWLVKNFFVNMDLHRKQ